MTDELVREHLRDHLTDGFWHDACLYCRTRRRRGGDGVNYPARRLVLTSELVARRFPDRSSVVTVGDTTKTRIAPPPVPDVVTFAWVEADFIGPIPAGVAGRYPR